jgi:hypothetical protein
MVTKQPIWEITQVIFVLKEKANRVFEGLNPFVKPISNSTGFETRC